MGLFHDVVNQLAFQIGPRPPGSKQEEAAARYLDRFFKDKALDSQVISFRSVRIGPQVARFDPDGMRSSSTDTTLASPVMLQTISGKKTWSSL